MLHEPSYPTAPRPTTFKDGIEFQDFVCELLASHHIILQNFASKKYQYEVGENLQGFEIKLDRRCTDTNRLSIEVAEKSNANNADWVNSGICRDDNSWLYIQGNYHVIFIFGKSQLRRYFDQVKPEVAESHGTVKKFYLSFSVARKMALKVIELEAA